MFVVCAITLTCAVAQASNKKSNERYMKDDSGNHK